MLFELEYCEILHLHLKLPYISLIPSNEFDVIGFEYKDKKNLRKAVEQRKTRRTIVTIFSVCKLNSLMGIA